MKKTMTEKQVDFCLNVYSQVQEVLFLRTQFAEDREVIFLLNQRTCSLGHCHLYGSDLARIEISEYALDDTGMPFMETLVHECIHACLPMYEHHGNKFKQACVMCGNTLASHCPDWLPLASLRPLSRTSIGASIKSCGKMVIMPTTRPNASGL